MSSTNRDSDSLKDIFDAASDVIRFLEGFDQSSFEQDRRTQRAVLHALVVVGEAVKRLSIGFTAAHAEIPWTAIAGARDVLIHQYRDVDLSEVWYMATVDVPLLRNYIDPLIPSEEDA